jgi:hypothetical protein
MKPSGEEKGPASMEDLCTLYHQLDLRLDSLEDKLSQIADKLDELILTVEIVRDNLYTG